MNNLFDFAKSSEMIVCEHPVSGRTSFVNSLPWPLKVMVHVGVGSQSSLTIFLLTMTRRTLTDFAADLF